MGILVKILWCALSFLITFSESEQCWAGCHSFKKINPLLWSLTKQRWLPSCFTVPKVHWPLMVIYLHRHWMVQTFTRFTVMHAGTEPGKLSALDLQGVPSSLIVFALPYRHQWHLVDLLSTIILSGKGLFLISWAMVYRKRECAWLGRCLGNIGALMPASTSHNSFHAQCFESFVLCIWFFSRCYLMRDDDFYCVNIRRCVR